MQHINLLWLICICIGLQLGCDENVDIDKIATILDTEIQSTGTYAYDPSKDLPLEIPDKLVYRATSRNRSVALSETSFASIGDRIYIPDGAGKNIYIFDYAGKLHLDETIHWDKTLGQDDSIYATGTSPDSAAGLTTDGQYLYLSIVYNPAGGGELLARAHIHVDVATKTFLEHTLKRWDDSTGGYMPIGNKFFTRGIPINDIFGEDLPIIEGSWYGPDYLYRGDIYFEVNINSHELTGEYIRLNHGFKYYWEDDGIESALQDKHRYRISFDDIGYQPHIINALTPHHIISDGVHIFVGEAFQMYNAYDFQGVYQPQNDIDTSMFIGRPRSSPTYANGNIMFLEYESTNPTPNPTRDTRIINIKGVRFFTK